MGEGSNMIYNIVSLVFLSLTVIVLIVVLGVMAGTMDPPIFAPEVNQTPPTLAPFNTATPSLAPVDAPGDAEVTLTPEAAQ